MSRRGWVKRTRSAPRAHLGEQLAIIVDLNGLRTSGKLRTCLVSRSQTHPDVAPVATARGHLLSPSGYTLVSNHGRRSMFDEQQESTADDRGDAAEEGSNMPSPPGERSSTEPVPATKGPDAGEGESSDSGEEDAV